MLKASITDNDNIIEQIKNRVLNICEQTSSRLMKHVAGKLCRDDLLINTVQLGTEQDADHIAWLCATYWVKEQQTPSVCLIAHDLMIMYDLYYSRALLCLAMKANLLWHYLMIDSSNISDEYIKDERNMNKYIKLVNTSITQHSYESVQILSMFKRMYPNLNPCVLPSLDSSVRAAINGIP